MTVSTVGGVTLNDHLRSVLGNVFNLNSGVPELDRVFTGGGASKMLTTIWLILMAAAFGAVTEYTAMLGRPF